MQRRFARRTARALAASGLLFIAAGSDLAAAAPVPFAPEPCRAPAGPDPFEVVLVPTAHANGAGGRVDLRFADSPFGVAVSTDGHHIYEARLRTTGLRAAGRVLVVWAATPELDQVEKLGMLDEAGALDGRIAFNKFLVFVTAEASADVERWAGPILLRGISPSGRMHTMAGHGPFQGEPCSKWGFGPGGAP